MKTTYPITIILLVFGNLSFSGEMQSVIHSSAPSVERNDHKWGIFVTVKHQADNFPGSYFSYRGSTKEIDDVKYSVSTVRTDERIETFRVRLSEQTLRHLITDRNEHEYLRFIAIRDLPDAELDPELTIELLTIATQEPNALIRSMTVKTLAFKMPAKDIVHLLVEMLNDPCISIAHETLLPLIDFYELKEPSGERPNITTSWFGQAAGLYHQEQQEVLRVAELLHSLDPKLISINDLNMIRSREVPSNEWYLVEGDNPIDIQDSKNDFRKQYLNVQNEEQDATDKPAVD